MKTKILLTLLAILPFVSKGQEAITKETPYVDVVGTGEMEIVPDEIYISFTLKERFDGKKKIDIEDQEKELKKKLLKLKIDLNDLQLADASADYVKIKRKKNDVIASKDYILKVTSTSMLADVFDVLDEVKAFNADIQRVDHSEIEKYRKEVKMMAVRNAKEKATYMLEAIGESVGKPIYIQERENYNEMPLMRKATMMALAAPEGADKQEEQLPELSFQKIKLKYQVSARFAIK